MKGFKFIFSILFLALPLLSLAQQMPDSAATEPLRLPSSDGNFKVSASLDNDSVLVGDAVTLRIHVEGCAGKYVQFPALEQLSQGGVEALEASFDTVRGRKDAVVSIEEQVLLMAFDEGRHYVNGIVVAIPSPEGRSLFAPADSLFLVVSYVQEADTNSCKMMNDADIIKENHTFWEIARWPLLALALAALVGALIWVLKRRKENQPIVPVPKSRQLPPDRRALADLEAVRRKELWQKGRIKRYYTDVTDIVRRFLHNLYGMPAGEMTTSQTLRAFHHTADWTEANESLLRNLLNQADMVKFARRQPESHEHDMAMQYAVDFVKGVAAAHAENMPPEEQERRKV